MTRERLEEIVSTLNGSRAQGGAARAAVLVGDLLAAFQQLPTALKSKPVTSAPTSTQFNELLADIEAVHRCLQSLASAMKDRSSR